MQTKETQQVVVLPSLQPKVNYHSFPRRYEETKPAIVQDFTHRRIVDLGHMIEEQTLTRCNLEKEKAVQETEARVWEEAEKVKQEALKKAMKIAEKENEKVMKKLNKAHEKALEEVSDHVRSEMKTKHDAQLHSVVEQWFVKVQDAIQQTKLEGLHELLLAVAKAREEEKEGAAKLRQKLLQAFDQKIKDKEAVIEAEKQQALLHLSAQKDVECAQAIENTRQSEQVLAAHRIEECKGFYEQNIRILQTHLHEKKEEIERLEKQLFDTVTAKDQMQKELLETREEFELFIHRVRPFNRTEPKFLLPPPKTIQLNMSEEEWRKLWH